MAAVSVRNTRGPRLTPRKPAASAADSSSPVSPPSGPISSSTLVADPSAAASRVVACVDSRSALVAGGRASSQARQLIGGRRSGSRLRPHCSHAAIAIARQCPNFRSACGAPMCTMVRSVVTGTMRVTPSSVVFCTTRSMRSLREIPWTSVTSTADSRSTEECSPTLTVTRSLLPASIVAENSPPVPSNRVSGSPARKRRTRNT